MHHHYAHFGSRHARFSRHPFGFDERVRGRGRGERGPRVFETGDLKLVLLSLIAEKPAHGYELIRDIEERLSGVYSPSPGVVYPTLTLLEELGLIEIWSQEGGRKLYRATDAGLAHLQERKAQVEGLFSRMSEASSRGGRPGPQVLRALESLKTALRYRLAAAPLSDEEMKDVVAAIDDAVARIEKR